MSKAVKSFFDCKLTMKRRARNIEVHLHAGESVKKCAHMLRGIFQHLHDLADMCRTKETTAKYEALALAVYCATCKESKEELLLIMRQIMAA